MKTKPVYEAPAILHPILLRLESSLLTGSVIDIAVETRVETAGQEVGGFFDGSDNSFNHEWGD